METITHNDNKTVPIDNYKCPEYQLSIEFSKNTGYFEMRHFIKNMEISCLSVEVFSHNGFIEPFGCHYSDLSTFAKQLLSPSKYKTICTKDIKLFNKKWYHKNTDNPDWFYINASVNHNNKKVRWGLYCSCPGDENPMEVFHLTLNYDYLFKFSEEITNFVKIAHDLCRAGADKIITGDDIFNRYFDPRGPPSEGMENKNIKNVISNIDFMLNSIPKKYSLTNNISILDKKSIIAVHDDSDSE